MQLDWRAVIMPTQVKQPSLISERTAALSDLAVTLHARIPAARNRYRYPGVDLLAPVNANEPGFIMYRRRDLTSTRLEAPRPTAARRDQGLRSLADR